MNDQLSNQEKGSVVYVVLVCLAAVLGELLFGYDTGVINGAIGPLRAHFALDASAEGWVTGCALLGCAIGAAVAGVLSDRLDRKLRYFTDVSHRGRKQVAATANWRVLGLFRQMY